MRWLNKRQNFSSILLNKIQKKEKFKSDLEIEYDSLSQFENRYQFKCNLDLHLNVKDNVIGKIVFVNT